MSARCRGEKEKKQRNKCKRVNNRETARQGEIKERNQGGKERKSEKGMRTDKQNPVISYSGEITVLNRKPNCMQHPSPKVKKLNRADEEVFYFNRIQISQSTVIWFLCPASVLCRLQSCHKESLATDLLRPVLQHMGGQYAVSVEITSIIKYRLKSC